MSLLNLFGTPSVRLDPAQEPPYPPADDTRNQSTNPFRSFAWNPFKSPIALPDIEEQPEPQQSMFALLGSDRTVVFALLLAGAAICYAICIFMFPVLSLKPRKFVLLWTLGLVFFLASFAFLRGFAAFFSGLFSRDRLAFKIAFFSGVFLTLYSSMVLKSTLLLVGFAIMQLLAQIYYTLSYVPWWSRSFGQTVALRQAESWMSS